MYFAHRQWWFPCKRRRSVHIARNTRKFDTSALVNCSLVAQDLSHRVRKRCVSQNSHSSHPAQCRTRPRCCFLHTSAVHHFPHALQSDFLPDLPTRPSLMSTSHGDLPSAEPSNVSFGHLAETHSPAFLGQKLFGREIFRDPHCTRRQTCFINLA